MAEPLSGLKTTKPLASKMEESIRGYLIDGKTVDQWRAEFRVSLSPEPTVEDIRRASSKIVELFSLASFYLASAQLASDAATYSARATYLEEFQKIVEERKQAGGKLPSGDTLQSLAESSMQEMNGAVTHLGMRQKFWKTILAALSEQRKSLEQTLWSLNLGYKMEA